MIAGTASALADRARPAAPIRATGTNAAGSALVAANSNRDGSERGPTPAGFARRADQRLVALTRLLARQAAREGLPAGMAPAAANDAALGERTR